MRKKRRIRKSKKYFNFKDFAKALGLWLAGIGINMIPMICNNIRTGDCFVSTLDMYFLTVSSNFLLVLEFFLFFPFIKNKSLLRVIRSILITINAILLLVYLILYFCNCVYSKVVGIMGGINLATFSILLIAGGIFICLKSFQSFKEVNLK